MARRPRTTTIERRTTAGIETYEQDEQGEVTRDGEPAPLSEGVTKRINRARAGQHLPGDRR